MRFKMTLAVLRPRGIFLLFVSWDERVSDDHMNTSVDTYVPQEAYTDVVKTLSVIHSVSFARVSPPLSDHAIVSPKTILAACKLTQRSQHLHRDNVLE